MYTYYRLVYVLGFALKTEEQYVWKNKPKSWFIIIRVCFMYHKENSPSANAGPVNLQTSSNGMASLLKPGVGLPACCPWHQGTSGTQRHQFLEAGVTPFHMMSVSNV